MKQIQTSAIVLRRINFGEADRILKVISVDGEKISLIAKGVRKPKSKLAGGLELLSISEITYIDGKSEIKTIVSTRLKKYFKNIVADISATLVAYEFMKIIDESSDHINDPVFFRLLETGFNSLDKKILSVDSIELWFYACILKINGNSINTEKPLNKAKFSEDKKYNFSPEDMCFFEDSNGVFDPVHIKFLRLIVKTEDPAKIKSILNYDKLSRDLKEVVKRSILFL